ncbi:MAG: alpha/beta hydrolase [Candidatus Cryptobacteroides sp.]
MKKPVKVTLIIVAVLIGLILLVGIGGGIYMVGYALDRDDVEKDFLEEREKAERKCPGILAWWDALEAEGILKDTVMLTADGRQLYAQYAAAAQPSTKTAILLHGYRNNPVTMAVYARMYRDSLGYNVFIPAMPGHGLSEGKAVQMGWKDRLDIISWIPVAHDIFQDESQVVHGMSMGGACTMMISGEETPDYVKAFIEDAGYTDVWSMFADQLKELFGLPPFPVLYGADLVCRLKYGWSFREASAVKQVAKSTKPMFFIHGGQDDFVPTYMLYPCYEAKSQGYKEIWEAPGSAHVYSIIDYPQEYCQRVRAFLEKAGI